MFYLLVISFIAISASIQLLSETIIKFQLQALQDSTTSYTLNAGFSRYQWLGIKFMTPTSTANYDILILQRSTSYPYITSITDYHMAQSSDKLIKDKNLNIVIGQQVQTESDTDEFEIQISRTISNNAGEDWQGGDFVDICFYTSEEVFKDKLEGMESCYGYQIKDYSSSNKGKYIDNMTIDGSSSKLYGGIEGPVLQLQLFWLVPSSSLSSSFIIGLGKVSQTIGNDYHKCESGDYFGLNMESLILDTLYSGYNDGQCEIVSQNNTKISYRRPVFTADDFDAKLYMQMEICAGVEKQNLTCIDVNFENLFLVSSLGSGVVISWEIWMLVWSGTFIITFLV